MIRTKLTIILIFCLLCTNTKATDKCDNALHACINYTKELEISLKLCNDQNDALTKELNKETDPLIPWWGWAIIGGVAGGIVVRELNR